MKDIIKYIRVNRNLSQQKFAEELGVAFATVNRWEQGITIPSDLIQNTLFEYCKKNNINLSIYILNKYTDEYNKLLLQYPNILFHGSKSGLENEINPRSRSYCDFGKGFYMGTEILQSLTLIANQDNPKLYFLSIDLENLSILKLEDNIEWALIIAINRGKIDYIRNKKIIDKYNNLLSNYDIIVGSIADDRMFFVLDLFFNGNITDKGLIESLTTLKLGKQIVAKNLTACSKIKVLKEYSLSVLELCVLREMSENNRKIGITQANEICKKYRREGKYFDEIIEEV